MTHTSTHRSRHGGKHTTPLFHHLSATRFPPTLFPLKMKRKKGEKKTHQPLDEADAWNPCVMFCVERIFNEFCCLVRLGEGGGKEGGRGRGRKGKRIFRTISRHNPVHMPKWSTNLLLVRRHFLRLPLFFPQKRSWIKNNLWKKRSATGKFATAL